MKKAELVVALSQYADRHAGRMKGQNILALFFARYFSNLDLPAYEKHSFGEIDPHIPQLLLGAFEEFRMSNDNTVQWFRARYEEETGQPVLDPTSIQGNGTNQLMTIQSLGYLFVDVVGLSWLSDRIDKIFNAERHLLQQVFYSFLNRVFRHGLFQIINESSDRGLSGTFGETTLRAYVIAGRLMLTFARPGEQREHSVSFVCTDNDALGLGGGAQSVYTDLQTAIAMINDVVAGWPMEGRAQMEALKSDENVTIG